VKIVKRLMTALMCLSVAFAAIMIPANAKAEGARVFTLHCEGGDWYFQTNEDSRWMGAGMINDYFNHGDSIVIEGSSTDSQLSLTITKFICDLCTSGGVVTNIKADGGVQRAYACYGSTMVVNGDVYNVLASSQGTIQVNGNVNILNADYASGTARYAITGTVDQATAKINGDTVITVYSVAAGKMIPGDNGIVKLNDGEYSTTPGATATTTTNTNNTANNANNANNNQLDDVPKTGSFVFEVSIVLIAAAVILGVASVVVLKKKTR